tara:strand:+ start:1200 stop:1412 length:213 start_codon:yes stop_codon:yes gene_type:complete
MDVLYYYYITKNWIVYNFGNYFSCSSNNKSLLEELMQEAHNDSNNLNDSNNSILNKNNDVKLESVEQIQK